MYTAPRLTDGDLPPFRNAPYSLVASLYRRSNRSPTPRLTTPSPRLMLTRLVCASYRRNRAGYSMDNFACLTGLLRAGRILLRLLVSLLPNCLEEADEACVPLDGTSNLKYDR